MATRTALGSVSAASSTTTLSIPIAAAINAGDLVVVGVNAGNGSAFNASDGTNTYTVAGTIGAGTTHATTLLYKVNASPVTNGTNIVVNWTTAGWHAGWATKWDAGASCVFDRVASSQGNSTSPTSGATSTLAYANSICMAVVGEELSGSSFTTPTGGFTIGQQPNTGVTNTELYQQVGTTAAVTAGGMCPSQNWGCIVATFGIPGGAGGTGGPATPANVNWADTSRALNSAQVVAPADSVGAADWSRPTYLVEVDWTNTGTWVNESANLLGISIMRGRARVNDVFGPGTATVTMKNTTGRFGPFNTLSALYPNVVPWRPLRMHASFQGISYPLYNGRVADINETAVPGYAAVQLSCLDGFEQLRLSIKAAATQTSQRTDQIIAAILAAASWTGGTTLDTGRTLTTYIQPTGSTLQGLQHAALQEVVGKLYLGTDGSVVFKNEFSRQLAPVWHVFTSTQHQTIAARQSDLIAEVDVSYGTHAGTGIAAQTTTSLSYGFTIGATAPALSAITLTATDHADGSGLNLSQLVWVRSISVAGAVATIGIYNSLPYTAYLQSVSGNGIGSLVGGAIAVVAAGAVVASQNLAVTFDYVTDTVVLNTWAQQAAGALKTAHPRPVVVLDAKTTELTHILLGADLGTRIVLSDTVSPHITGMVGQFFIEHIQLDLVQGAPPKATWQLFDTYQGSL